MFLGFLGLVLFFPTHSCVIEISSFSFFFFSVVAFLIYTVASNGMGGLLVGHDKVKPVSLARLFTFHVLFSCYVLEISLRNLFSQVRLNIRGVR